MVGNTEFTDFSSSSAILKPRYSIFVFRVLPDIIFHQNFTPKVGGV
jgi:hypothetical protein